MKKSMNKAFTERKKKKKKYQRRIFALMAYLDCHFGAYIDLMKICTKHSFANTLAGPCTNAQKQKSIALIHTLFTYKNLF